MTKEERENDCFGKLIKKDIPPMSTEQAIEVLHELDGSLYETQQVALDLAIKALEQQSEDCVSRQAVKDIIHEYKNNIDSQLSWLSDGVCELPPVTPTQRWIPVSERLPNDRNWHLGIFKESDTGWINPIPFICDYVGRETRETTKEYWILRGFTDKDEHIDYYFNLECVAWQPLPKPYEEKRGNENGSN